MNDCQLIADLKRQQNIAYGLMYELYYPVTERYILRNNGTEDDARDVFQETLLVLMDRIPKEDFQLTSSLKTYVFSIASRIWLKKLRDAKKIAGTPEHSMMPDAGATAFELKEEAATQNSFLQQVFNSVTSHCQLLLMRIFLEEARREDLVAEMGYKNTHTFDNQKYKCLMQAKKSVQKM